MANPVETLTARGAFAITPSDTTVIMARALYVGTGGDLAVVTDAGQTVTFTGVLGGTILPVKVSQVKAATTASNIVGMTY